VDVQCRAIVNLDQRKAVAKAKKAAAAVGTPPRWHSVFGSQGSVSSPTSMSPSSLVTLQEGHGYTPLSRFSPSPSSGEYPDNDPHSGFNPNAFFTLLVPHHDGFNTDSNVAYGASPRPPSWSSLVRRPRKRAALVLAVLQRRLPGHT
jgi:hypothetical protein